MCCLPKIRCRRSRTVSKKKGLGRRRCRAGHGTGWYVKVIGGVYHCTMNTPGAYVRVAPSTQQGGTLGVCRGLHFDMRVRSHAKESWARRATECPASAPTAQHRGCDERSVMIRQVRVSDMVQNMVQIPVGLRSCLVNSAARGLRRVQCNDRLETRLREDTLIHQGALALAVVVVNIIIISVRPRARLSRA